MIATELCGDSVTRWKMVLFWGLWLRNTYCLKEKFVYVSFSHVLRDGNSVGHELASLAQRSNEHVPTYWLEDC